MVLTVFGFVGPSGTGKSHRALELARRLFVSYIIDDGLLIKGNTVLAGTSAKREPSKLASVRRALFTDDDHMIAVTDAIADAAIESVIILGTSVNMVDKIAKRLRLPPVKRYIDISEIATDEEIEAARRVRLTEGKHVIPAPTFALKKEFSGYFMTPLKRLVRLGRYAAQGANEFKRQGRLRTSDFAGERTIVRPTFSYLGNYTISRAAVLQLIVCVAQKPDGVVRVLDVSIELTDEGLKAVVLLMLEYGCRVHETLSGVISLLRYEIDRQTAINVRKIDVTAKTLQV